MTISDFSCQECRKTYPIPHFYHTSSPFFPYNILPICPSCALEIVDSSNLQHASKWCQWADWPFYPDIWMQLYENADATTLDTYYHKIIGARKVSTTNEDLDWSSLNSKWREMMLQGSEDSLLPQSAEHEEKELRQSWEPDGEKQYSIIELRYMERLFRDLEKTQKMATGAQIDQARKLSRLSLDMDRAQKKGDMATYTKLMGAYEKLIKTAEFTPKNASSHNSFETVGELFHFLERTGFINKFYDGEERDIVDKTIRSQQQFLRRIVAGDQTLSERIEKRLERADLLDRLEDGLTSEEEWSYDISNNDDWIDNTTFETCISKDEEEEMDAEDDEDPRAAARHQRRTDSGDPL